MRNSPVNWETESTRAEQTKNRLWQTYLCRRPPSVGGRVYAPGLLVIHYSRLERETTPEIARARSQYWRYP